MTNKSIRDYINLIENAQQDVVEGQMPKTWQDIDPTVGKQVDKMSQAEKVKKGFAHPDTLNTEKVYKVVALDKSNALKKPTKLNVKASSIEDVFSRLAANDWYALSINGVEVIAGKRLKQGVAEDSPTMWEVSYDYGPHMTKTVKVKASSEEEAIAKVEKAAEKRGLSIMINSVEPVGQGVAEEQLEETTPEAIAKIDELTRK